MGRRKKRRRRASSAPEAAPAADPPVRLHRPFAGALERFRATEDGERESSEPDTLPPPGPPRPETVPSTLPPSGPDPPERPSEGPDRTERTYEDRVAFAQAFADVEPLPPRRGAYVADADLHRPRPSRGASPQGGHRSVAADASARERLDALVGGGARFRIDRDDDRVQGVREGAPKDALRAIERRGVAPEARLDLHGMVGDEAAHAVGRFVRERHRHGDRCLLVVHGKGTHSEGGIGVLGDRVVDALTEGAAAPLVDAFVTAPARLGGSGALLVQLVRK